MMASHAYGGRALELHTIEMSRIWTTARFYSERLRFSFTSCCPALGWLQRQHARLVSCDDEICLLGDTDPRLAWTGAGSMSCCRQDLFRLLLEPIVAFTTEEERKRVESTSSLVEVCFTWTMVQLICVESIFSEQGVFAVFS